MFANLYTIIMDNLQYDFIIMILIHYNLRLDQSIIIHINNLNNINNALIFSILRNQKCCLRQMFKKHQ